MQGQTHLPDKALRTETDGRRDGRGEVPHVAVGERRPAEMERVRVAETEEEGEERETNSGEAEAADRQGEEDRRPRITKRRRWRENEGGAAVFYARSLFVPRQGVKYRKNESC